MNDWFSQYIRTNPAVQQSPTPANPLQVPAMSQANPNQLIKPLVDKIRKYGAEEFQATINDDGEKAEFWLENTIRVFDELSLSPEECIKCVVSLLRDTTYHLWKTLKFVILSK